MARKKILFVMEQLGIGGAEKSLITLLSCLDYKKYEVDLFLFRKTGEFLALLPKQVTILPEAKEYLTLVRSPIRSVYRFLLEKKLNLAGLNVVYLMKLVFYHFILKKEYVGWNYLRSFFSPGNKEYDVAIGYLEKKTTYFVVDLVNAKKKIGYVHTNYLKMAHDKKIDSYYFSYLDSIATVSRSSLAVLQRTFCQYPSKFRVIENIISPECIRAMGQEDVEPFWGAGAGIVLVTIARLVEEKGLDTAILVCRELIKAKPKLRWYVIGEGSERKKLEGLIKSYGLSNHFFLLGARTNPYKYINKADIYVQPSRTEGYGITVAEAKMLEKPIVVSNIPEFQEQIIHGKTGLLCDSTESMVKAVLELLHNDSLRQKIADNLKIDNDRVQKLPLEHFYQMIG